MSYIEIGELKVTTGKIVCGGNYLCFSQTESLSKGFPLGAHYIMIVFEGVLQLQ